jgi:hypothetical protein
VLPTARDHNGLCVRIDAVLDQLGDGLERIALRARDDADRVPIIADPQFGPLRSLGLHVPYILLSRREFVIHYIARIILPEIEPTLLALCEQSRCDLCSKMRYAFRRVRIFGARSPEFLLSGPRCAI